MLVEVTDLLLPRELTPFEDDLAPKLIDQAEELVREAFLRAGRDLDAEVVSVAWMPLAVKRVIREMVTAALLVGASRGMRSAQSTTGPQSDSVTWADVESVALGGLVLTDKQREDLGLGSRGPLFRFPSPSVWPEVSTSERDYRGYW